MIFADQLTVCSGWVNRVRVRGCWHYWKVTGDMWQITCTTRHTASSEKGLKLSKMHKKVLQSAHIKRVSVSRMSVPILPSSRLMSAKNVVKFWRTFVMSTTLNQFKSHIFRLNFLKLVVAAQDYDLLHLSHFSELPGWPKWTLSSPQTFKLSSGELKVIQLATWYHVLFLGPWTIHFLFQKPRNIIMLSVTKLQTHLSPPPAGRQLDWGGGCSTGTLPFKGKDKRTVP